MGHYKDMVFKLMIEWIFNSRESPLGNGLAEPAGSNPDILTLVQLSSEDLPPSPDLGQPMELLNGPDSLA